MKSAESINPLDLIEKQWSETEKFIVRKALPIIGSGISNEEMFNTVFEAAYEALPLPIRIILPRNTFLNYCENKRTNLSEKIAELSSVAP